MKPLIKGLLLLFALTAIAWMLPQEACAQQGSVSFQLFYDQLSPYGMWVEYPNYGYVWIPTGDPEFSPYATSGHWVFTEDGWTWVSDYPWGWAPFHYGRWDRDDAYGWFWVPGEEWGPAWVSWRRSPGYYGWAPLRPGISISIALGRDYHERNERWIFVGERDMVRPDVSRHYVDRTQNVTIINNSTVIVNTRKDSRRNATYIAGPDRDDVQRITKEPVTPVAIRESNQPGHRLSSGELQIYRPQVQRKADNAQAPAPSRVMKPNEVKPALERNAGNRPQDVNAPGNARKDQQPGSPTVRPSPGRGDEKQSPDVTPSVDPRRAQQRVSPIVRPSPGRGNEKQAPTVAPPTNARKAQQPASRTVKPAPGRGKERAPANVTPPNKNRKAQPLRPEVNQEEKEKGKRNQ